MRKHPLAFGILLIVIAAPACSGRAPRPAPAANALAPDSPAGLPPAEPEPPKRPAPAPAPEPRAEPEKDPGVAVLAKVQPAPVRTGFAISLERTACFGTCPSYVVTVRANGAVTFVGESPDAGCATKSVPVAEVGKLAALVKQSNFFGMKAQYRALVTDHPWAHIEVRMTGRTKKVSHYLADDFAKDDPEARASLRDLEAAIDTVTGALELAKGKLTACK